MDRFQELSKIALDELSEVFARMSDENTLWNLWHIASSCLVG